MSSVLPIPFEFDPASHIFRKQGIEVPSVTQVLARAGICDYSFVDEETREYSMARGTSVHWMTQLEDEGGLDYRRVPWKLRGYRKAWRAWKQASEFRPVTIEQQFISRYGYAGIIDRVGSLPPLYYPNVVVDIKTGAVPDWARYQLAAYSVFAAGDNPKYAAHFRRIAVRLCLDGTYKVREFPRATWQLDWCKFISLVGRINGNA